MSLIEQQIHRWRYRLPDLSDDSSRERVISAVEVKKELDKLKDITKEKVREVTMLSVPLSGKSSCSSEPVMNHGRQSVSE